MHAARSAGDALAAGQASGELAEDLRGALVLGRVELRAGNVLGSGQGVAELVAEDLAGEGEQLAGQGVAELLAEDLAGEDLAGVEVKSVTSNGTPALPAMPAMEVRAGDRGRDAPREGPRRRPARRREGNAARVA